MGGEVTFIRGSLPWLWLTRCWKSWGWRGWWWQTRAWSWSRARSRISRFWCSRRARGSVRMDSLPLPQIAGLVFEFFCVWLSGKLGKGKAWSFLLYLFFLVERKREKEEIRVKRAKYGSVWLSWVEDFLKSLGFQVLIYFLLLHFF